MFVFYFSVERYDLCSVLSGLSMLAIEFEGIHFEIGVGRGFEGLSLSVEEGQCCLISEMPRMGSRALCRLALGLVRPDRGTVRVLGVDVSHGDISVLHNLRMRAGFVYRGGSGLISNLSVERNIALPLNYHRTLKPRAVQRRSQELIELLDLGEVKDTRPIGLSPPQRVQTALARSAVMAPEILLCDDPLSGLPANISHRVKSSLGRVRDWIASTREDRRQPSLLIGATDRGPYSGVPDISATYVDGGVTFEEQEELNF